MSVKNKVQSQLKEGSIIPMNKTLTMVYRLLIILLAVAFAYTTVLPVITFKMDNSKLGEDSLTLDMINTFEELKNEINERNDENYKITSEFNIPEGVEIGISPVFKLFSSLVRNIDCINLIIEMVGSEDDSENEGAASSEGYTEEELKEDILKQLLNDQELLDSVVSFAYAVDMLQSITDTDMESSENDLGMICFIFSLIALLFLVLIAFIYPIVMAIKLIVFIIRMLKHLTDVDSDKADRLINKFPFSSHLAFLLVFYLVFAICNSGGNFAPGTSITYAMVIFFIVSVLQAINAVLVTDEDRVHIIIKQVISVVSIVAVAVLMPNFMAVDVLGEFDNARLMISATQYASELSNGNQSPQEVIDMSELKNTVIVFFISLLGVGLMCGTLLSLIERFSNKKVKLRGKGYVPRKAMIFASVVVLLIALYPTVISVDSAEARKEAYASGSFKIWYTEYLEEGTSDNIEYEFLKATEDKLTAELEEIRGELSSAEGERAEELKTMISEAEKSIETINDQIDEFEAYANRPKLCLIPAVVFLISEIVYGIVYKRFDGSDKNAEKESAAVA